LTKINALANNGKARILSSPRLLTKDNEQASIQVGTQVAVVGSEISNVQAGGQATPNLLRSFTYVNTGIILTFTPTILDDGKVELKVTQEVSDAGASSTNTPPINTRKVQTVLIAESGQTIMIGGLIKSNETINDSKVPWLGDIPWLGHLFSNVKRTDNATNMVVLLTPHIVTSSAEASYLTKEFQKQLQWTTDSPPKSLLPASH
jgi:general secretion pathway protein D